MLQRPRRYIPFSSGRTTVGRKNVSFCFSGSAASFRFSGPAASFRIATSICKTLIKLQSP